MLYERVCCIVRTTGTNPRRSGKGGRGGRRLGGGGRNKVRADIGDASDGNESGDELEDEDDDDGFDLPPMEEITGECECVCSIVWIFLSVIIINSKCIQKFKEKTSQKRERN